MTLPFVNAITHFPHLILVFKETNYFPDVGLGAQIEATVLTSAGAMWGLGYGNSMLAFSRFLARKYGEDCVSSRAVIAIGVCLHAFTGAYMISRFPRLMRASTTSIYLGVWVLLVKIGTGKMSVESFTEPGFCFATAAFLSFLCALPLLLNNRSPLAQNVIEAYGTVHNLLKSATTQMLDRTDFESKPSDLDDLASQLFKQSQALPANFLQATFELRWGRLPADPLKDLIASVERLRAQLSLGLPAIKNSSLEHLDASHLLFLDTVETGTQALGKELEAALALCMESVRVSYDLPEDSVIPIPMSEKMRTGGARVPLQPEHCLTVRTAIDTASKNLRTDIRAALNKLLADHDVAGVDESVEETMERVFHREMFGICLFLASLLEVSQECWKALKQAEDLLKAYNAAGRKRLLKPHLSWAWLGISEKSASLENASADHRTDDNTDKEKVESQEEIERAQAELLEGGAPPPYAPTAAPFSDVVVRRKPGSTEDAVPAQRFSIVNKIFMSISRKTFKPRMKLAGFIRSIRNSRHVKYAIRAAIGALILSIPAVLPKNSPLRKNFEKGNQQWQVIGFIMGLDMDIGSIIRKNMFRVMGTLVGCAYAYLCWIICRHNAAAKVAMVTAFQIPASWVFLRSSIPSCAITAVVTIPTIVFAPWKEDSNIWTMGASKASALITGLMAALIASLLIFPLQARTEFMTQIAKAIDALSLDYVTLSRPFLKTSHVKKDYRNVGLEIEGMVKERLRMADRLLGDMMLELSLLPKPTQFYGRVEVNIRRILDLFLGLRHLRENIPHKRTVREVLDSRMHLVSSQIMVMFALSHCFRAQMPLPQFLPSSQHALEELIGSLREHWLNAHKDRLDGETASDLGSMFSLAESEAMAEVAEALEDLTHLTSSIFGSLDWWDGNSPTTALPMANEKKKHYWNHVWRDITHRKALERPM
ncbi:hypothetical protein DACRYDRAFT_110197 [Dacryopinax primogenitus]|uniref:Integral membrane bound transporter domain-containing protein n=1 Tax=Dacryopinax primogenitus (strain DJM 731) TaxID=1858805 RepID=M5FPY8_DACPD|nr:uncharacterized protein DACRYDRAFT_110197 [Dacryopinax primogenitus]EJT98860.1 hypothetical protein DACRYDRAFT_110197 [Dacryopinax primogenitus]